MSPGVLASGISELSAQTQRDATGICPTRGYRKGSRTGSIAAASTAVYSLSLSPYRSIHTSGSRPRSSRLRILARFRETCDAGFIRGVERVCQWAA